MEQIIKVHQVEKERGCSRRNEPKQWLACFQKEHRVCVEKYFDLARSKGACRKDLLVRIGADSPKFTPDDATGEARQFVLQALLRVEMRSCERRLDAQQKEVPLGKCLLTEIGRRPGGQLLTGLWLCWETKK